MTTKRTSFTGLASLVFVFSIVANGQSPKVRDAAELKLAVQKLSVLGSVLYLAAHPDDENTALLAYLSKGRLVRTAYLAVTRGEGGQNLIGPEQGDELGVIRTQELLAARRVDGAEQYFTRAIDFGYSKTSDETMQIWGKDKILSDVVWIIRKLRPDVIITRFSPTIGGHGNHTSSAILAQEAFTAASDPRRFPQQLQWVKPWQAKRLLFNTARFFDSAFDTAKALKVDVGEFSPLLGRSFTEIAGISRTNHKSQGFGAAQTRGPAVNYFHHTSGDPARTDLLDGVDLTWSRVPGSQLVGNILQEAAKTFDCTNPSASVPLLLKAYAEMNRLNDDYWVDLKKNEIKDIIRECSGVWLDALASDYSAVPGNQVKVAVSAIQRSGQSVSLDSVGIPFSSWTVPPQTLGQNVPTVNSLSVALPANFSYTRQYWLREPAEKGSYNISDQTLIGMPGNMPPLIATFYLTILGQHLSCVAPIQYRWVDPVDGEQYRPFEIIPPVSLNLEEKVFVFSDEAEKEIALTIKGGMPNVSGKIRLELPQGWSAKPESIPFELKEKNDEKVIRFTIKASKSASNGSFVVVADVGDRSIAEGIITIKYRHIPPETMFPSASGKLVRMDLSTNGKTVGYIMGAGDEIPTALRQMGYQVTLVSDDDLANRDFSKVDVIIAGVRAYNTRPALRVFQKRLMEYVQNGGTYIVQYTTLQRPESENLGPYPFSVSRDRVTVEDAPIVFLNSKHPLLNNPNKISEDDFKGWIQERGLYFADKWDSRYDTVIASADPGESLKPGGLLYTKYGKGHYIYTGYAFFRQLPGGVPGAYRLFSNMLSVGKEEKIKRMSGVERTK